MQNVPRIVARAAWPSVLARAFVPWLTVFFAVAQLDAVVDWPTLAAIWGGLPSTIAGAAGVGLAATWLWGTRGLMRAAVAHAHLRWLSRSPLTLAQTYGVLVLALLPATAPLWLLAWVTGRWTTACAMLAMWVLGGPAWLAVRPWRALGVVALAWVASVHPVLAPVMVGIPLVVAPGVRASVQHIYAAPKAAVWSWPGVSGVLPTLVWRDALTLWRVAPAALVTVLVFPSAAWAMGPVIDRSWPGPSGETLAALVWIVGWLCIAPLLAHVARAQGRQFDLPSHGTTAMQRVVSLVAWSSVAAAWVSAPLWGRGPVWLGLCVWTGWIGTCVWRLCAPGDAARRGELSGVALFAMVLIAPLGWIAPWVAPIVGGVGMALAGRALQQHRRTRW